MRDDPMLVMGIDEAGRGPGLGPMVLAAVVVDPAGEEALSRAGVRDSKAFGSSDASRKRRADLARVIRAHARWVSVEVCEVEEIDAYVERSALNQLERERAQQLISAGPACSRIITDGKTLFSPLRQEIPHLEALDRAESAHVAVAAASVCAKATRDEKFAAIASQYRQEFGELGGGGYVNPATCAFVAEFVRRYGRLPPEARKSWPWRGIIRPAGDGPSSSPLPTAQVR